MFEVMEGSRSVDNRQRAVGKKYKIADCLLPTANFGNKTEKNSLNVI